MWRVGVKKLALWKIEIEDVKEALWVNWVHGCYLNNGVHVAVIQDQVLHYLLYKEIVVAIAA